VPKAIAERILALLLIVAQALNAARLALIASVRRHDTQYHAMAPAAIISSDIIWASLKPHNTRGLIRTNSTIKRAAPAKIRYKENSSPLSVTLLRINHRQQKIVTYRIAS